MKEFLLLIRSEGDCADQMEPEVYKNHLTKVIDYINDLKSQDRLISAQPLTMSGFILQGKGNSFKDGPFIESKEVISGYFLFKANSLKEAKGIAISHPLLEDDPSSRIEIREIKYEKGIN